MAFPAASKASGKCFYRYREWLPAQAKRRLFREDILTSHRLLPFRLPCHRLLRQITDSLHFKRSWRWPSR